MGMLLTDAQRKWVDILKESAKKKPPDHSIRPKVRSLFVDRVNNSYSDSGNFLALLSLQTQVSRTKSK